MLILPMQSASAHLFHTWPHKNTELTVPQLSLVRSTRNAATAGTLHYVLFTVLTAMPFMKAILITVYNLYKVGLLYLGIICSTHIHLTLCQCYTGCRTSLHKKNCKQQQQELKSLHPSNSQGDGVFHTTGSSLVATEAAARLFN